MDMTNFRPLDINAYRAKHSKTLYRSICVPSAVQSYNLCVEYMKSWFLSKFPPDVFKTVYVEGKYVLDDYRKFNRTELIKRPKPALTITPSLSWDFNNEHIDTYPYGMDLYVQTGKFKESFFAYPSNNSYMGIGMKTILMPFNFKIKVETRAQQMDMYEYIKMACRVGFTCGEDVDLDFHLPYTLMIQIAKDNGFKITSKKVSDTETEEAICNVPEFLRWLNKYSRLPFIYKFRAMNGKNEFFLKMRDMYVHIRPTSLDADDGEREGVLTNNYIINMNVEVRFPAPKMYAYYSDNEHKLQTVYGAWYQPSGPVTTCYTFKGNIIPDINRYKWPLFMSTTYEDDNEDNIDKPLSINLTDLFDGDIGECISDCLSKSISPAIFCDLIFYNGGEYINASMDWETMIFTSTNPVRALGTYIGVYVDNNFVSDCILKNNKRYMTRINESE